ncbi:HPP family protein [Variovorax ginsengisoli]|uniref:HPP family protein n=1 Tax=Variovorax ginsengisoli TaxID=363844 RepID=A0ABT8SCS8_9BURK|nr:HPP family protein [Variovorax ginsengisoli]MDN8617531.1 HPP family protein [Variovorax ginsengisoli]MDO1536701.1 HPP family protein [Variovorax ginsengisoli]
MNLTLPRWLTALLPARATVSQAERLRSGLGALLGIFLTGFLSAVLLDSPVAAAWLIAPMGASAVLLFGVPASPLAQPWSILGGNLVAALIGVTCAKTIHAPIPAAAVAIFFAIGAMFALHCVHPPSGAVALTAVLGGPEIHAAGYGFVVAPVGLNSMLLLLVAVIYNRAAGRRYPHSQQPEAQRAHQTDDLVPMARLGFTAQDIQAAVKDYDQVLDVSEDDLDALFRRTEMHAFRRRFGDTFCRDIMSKDVVAVEFGTELAQAWTLMRVHEIEALPVLNSARHVIGILTRSDFIYHADLSDYTGMRGRLKTFLRRTDHTHSDKHEVVGQIMSTNVKTALDSTPLAELVPLMSDAGFHHLPVVDSRSRLVGMVTQTDLVGALYETGLARIDGDHNT